MSDHRLSPEAEADLEEIWHFIAQDDGFAADKFIGELLVEFRRLDHTPYLGRERDDLRVGLRSIAHGNYTIVYHVRHETAEILRVVHGARDLKQLFQSN